MGAGGAEGAHSSIEAVLNKVDVIIDSPLAATFTEYYKILIPGKNFLFSLDFFINSMSLLSNDQQVTR